VREWTLTFPIEFPLWELEFWWTPKFSKGDCKGQNPLDCKVPYIIKKLLERRCLKWALMTHLDTLKHKLWPKERSRIKLSIWLPTTKSQESPWFPCVKVACHILLEISRPGLRIFFRPHLNQTFSRRVMGFQSCKSSNFEIFKTPTWKSWDKMTFRCYSCGHAQSIL